MIEVPRLGDGKRRRRKRKAATKADAQRALKEMQKELERSGTILSADRTIHDAIATFRAGRPPSANDDWLFGLIASGLGSYRVRSLSVRQCDLFLAECAEGRYGRRPIGKDHLRRVRQRLAALMRNEVRIGTVARNVAEVAELPSSDIEPRRRRALTVEELHMLLEASGGWLKVLIDLCGRNGLRPAEARALRWIDVDLQRGELSISGQMNRDNERGPVKRATNAERTIGIDGATLERLAAWRREADEGEAPTDQDFIATNRTGGPTTRESLATAVKTLCGEILLAPHVTPYELRHTAISHQADAGRTSWEIADWAGTSESMISSRYRHRLRRISVLRPADTIG
ncbi:MAG: tyrosine-type recombinase/integrase [Actinomycetota bacterium]